MSFWNPIDKVNEWLSGIAKETANLGFDLLSDYMLTPTDFDKIQYASQAQAWIQHLSLIAGALFLVYNLLKHQVGQGGGFSRRSTPEIVIKSICAAIFTTFSSWIIPDFLLPINNYYVEYLAKIGIETKTIEKMITKPELGAAFIIIIFGVFAVLLLITGIQMILRFTEIGVLIIFAPLAAITMQNEEMNMFPVWWRESIATVFQQAFQLTILWLILNLFGSGNDAKDYLFAIGGMVVLITTPRFMRGFLYSSGAGAAVVNAAGGVSKAAIYKYSMKKMMTK